MEKELRHIESMEYKDESIAFHFNLSELPMENGSMRVKACMIVACSDGKMHIDINEVSYTLRQNDILVCRPNDMIDNCMVSPDFRGVVLSISRHFLHEQMAVNQLWSGAFHVAKNPIITINEQSMEMFSAYGKALQAKVKMPKTKYHTESILSIVKAMLYELLDFMDNDDTDKLIRKVSRQSNVLFRQFIQLIADKRVKPRYVGWYAEQLCVTSKHLSEAAKKESGKTAFYWINEYVKKDVRYMLKNSDLSIKEISEALDFPNLSFFGKYCRQHFGMSPMKYREQLRKPAQ